jgi:hypothetical protein
MDETQCGICGEYLSAGRWQLGYKICLFCGEEQARQERLSWCIAPISNKAGYTRVTDYSLLKQINPKFTEV